jgi:CDP-diacylglycerol pyrophosphatase
MHWLQRCLSIAWQMTRVSIQWERFRQWTDLIRGIGNREYVWRQVTQSAILVQLNIFGVVNGIEFEWINGDENGAHISVNMAFVETGFQIFQ